MKRSDAIKVLRELRYRQVPGRNVFELNGKVVLLRSYQEFEEPRDYYLTGLVNDKLQEFYDEDSFRKAGSR